MRKQENRPLYWGPISSADYLWGSVIERLAEDQIRFMNPLMPSGQVLNLEISHKLWGGPDGTQSPTFTEMPDLCS